MDDAVTSAVDILIGILVIVLIAAVVRQYLIGRRDDGDD